MKNHLIFSGNKNIVRSKWTCDETVYIVQTFVMVLKLVSLNQFETHLFFPFIQDIFAKRCSFFYRL